MDHDAPITIALPRFTRWMRLLAIYVALAWGVNALLAQVARAALPAPVVFTALVPGYVLARLQLWRLVSYPLIEADFTSALFTVLGLWWFGSPVERALGARRTWELLAAGVAGGALFVMLRALLFPAARFDAAVGMHAVTSALLAGWGFAYATQRVSLFGLAEMSGKQAALGFGALTVLSAALSQTAAGTASVGGLLVGAGWMWLRGQLRTPPDRRKRRASGGRLRAVPGGKGPWLN